MSKIIRTCQCTFCGDGIEDPSKAVVITARWMPTPSEAGGELPWQEVYAHSRCLETSWTGRTKWEQHVLYGDDEPD